ncbi:hypothetical protein [Cysteiniphilum sp. 19S12-1]|uniref:hypothetical protein n=1 Tax=Cysteiniphilum sp. 19S12-1 TaxID=3453130 RepID=UPI003F824952
MSKKFLMFLGDGTAGNSWDYWQNCITQKGAKFNDKNAVKWFMGGISMNYCTTR